MSVTRGQSSEAAKAAKVCSAPDVVIVLPGVGASG